MIQKDTMKSLRILAVATCLAMLSGCASNSNRLQYNPDKSFALNIAWSAGMRDIRDQNVEGSDAVVERLTKDPIYRTTWATYNYYNPAHGFSSGGALTLGLLGILFAPSADSSTNHIIAWMPSELAEDENDAASIMRNIVHKAIQDATPEINLSVLEESSDYSKWSGQRSYVIFENKAFGCLKEPPQTKDKSIRFCAAVTKVKKSNKTFSPNFLGRPPYESYAFAVSMDNRNGLNLVLPPSSTVAEQAFFQAVSKHLPEWAYLCSACEEKRSQPI